MHVDTFRRLENRARGKNARIDDSNYILKIGFKLMILSVAVGASHLLVPWLINRRFFRLNKAVPIYVALVPVIAFVIYLFGGKGKIMSRLALCKYHSRCSFLFIYDDHPVRSRRINLKRIMQLLRPGDVILRKHHNYLDGLIFAQNSYFTHIGICTAMNGTGELQVFHATSEKGVASDSVAEYCNCDDVAVLRFAPDRIKTKEEITAKDIVKYEQEAKKIRRYIRKDNRVTATEPELKRKELAVFEKLHGDFSSGLQSGVFLEENYIDIITERARSLEKTSYDLMFNFKNFSKLSCIEYVWYSYKCLFPLHRIKVEDFEYFRCITLPVIIPDVFIKNNYFKHVYSSIPGVESTEQLRKFVKSKRSPLWRFALNILVWDALILCIVYPLLRRRSRS